MVKILFVAEVNRRLEELDCADEVPINGLHIFHSYNNWLLGQNHACLGSWDDARIWKLRRTSAPLSSAQIDKLLKRGMETDNTDLLKSNELYQPSGRGDTSTNVALLITHSPSSAQLFKTSGMLTVCITFPSHIQPRLGFYCGTILAVISWHPLITR